MRVVMDLNRLLAHRNLVYSSRLPVPSGFAQAPTPSSFSLVSPASGQSADQVDSRCDAFRISRFFGSLCDINSERIRSSLGFLRIPVVCQMDGIASRRRSPHMDSVSAFSDAPIEWSGFFGSFFAVFSLEIFLEI